MDVISNFRFNHLPDGSVELAIQYADKTHRAGMIGPELVAQMLATLINLVPQATDPSLRRHGQLLAIREVAGRVDHGIATLSYELEAGVQLQSTISADSARALSLALAPATLDPTKH